MTPFAADSSSAVATRRVHDVHRHPRLARELATMSAMIRIHCHDLHGEDHGLCEECAALLAYATRRLDRCIFGDDKPTCANCQVHCYREKPRAQIRGVMRYAGPRMLRRHPVLSIRHVIDGWCPAPSLPDPARR